jgi:hypothetical protein
VQSPRVWRERNTSRSAPTPSCEKSCWKTKHPPRAAKRPLVATPRSGVREEGGCKGEKDESQEVLKKWTDEEHTNRKTLLGQLERKLGE